MYERAAGNLSARLPPMRASTSAHRCSRPSFRATFASPRHRAFGKPIVLYDVQSIGAQAYMAIADELIAREKERRRRRSGPSPVPAVDGASIVGGVGMSADAPRRLGRVSKR